jgi:hypothetical protein
MRPAARTVFTLEQAGDRRPSSRARMFLLLLGAVMLVPAGTGFAASEPSPDPSPQVQPDPVPQPTSAPSARRQGPSSAAPAPVRTVSAPVTSTPATVPVQRPAARASAHPGGGHRYRSSTSRAGRRLSPLLSGLRLTRLHGLAPPAPNSGPDGLALLLAGIALTLVVTAGGSLLRMTLRTPPRDLRRGPVA